MTACDYDLEVFSKYIYVHEDRQIKVLELEETGTSFAPKAATSNNAQPS